MAAEGTLAAVALLKGHVPPFGGPTFDAPTMYKDHFRLRAMPFSIAPDPTYFYLSNQHRDAWMHLRRAVDGEGGGVLLLTGEVGAGKTTVCRRLLDDLPGHVRIALVHNPRLTPHDLLLTACQQFGITDVQETASPVELEVLLAQHLTDATRAGQVRVLIVDEAQGLSADALEQLRQLAAAERGGHGGLRIVLIGQPELNDLLARGENAGFDQCIAMRYHLGPLARSDVVAYVAHRLSVAGCSKPLIPRRLIGRLHRMSEGIPRVINLICDRALLGAFVLGKEAVSRRILEEAWGEATGREPGRAGWLRRAWVAVGAAGLLTAGAVLAVASRPDAPQPKPVAPPAAVDVSLAGLDPKDATDWPDGMGGKRSEALAYAALFRRWNVPVPENASPCTAARQQGLMCVQGHDELDVLRRLNRPAVLQLADRAGRQMYVTLIEIESAHAVLQLGTALRKVPISVLESAWTRQYTLVWRPPPELAGSVEPGAKGPPVDWMRQRIAKLKGVEALSLPPQLEGKLKAHLQDFQSLEGLRATGAGDLRTLVHLASRTESGSPVLDSQHCGR